MITKSRALGAHVYFFREGAAYTVPSSGTCSSTSKPGSADTGWVDLGYLEDVTIEKKSNVIEVFAASPGQLVRGDVIETKKTLDLSFTCQQMSDLALEALFGTAPLAAGDTQFNPLEGGELKGWVKLQVYDQNDDQFVVVDLWVYLKADGSTSLNAADGNLNKVKFMGYVMHSPYNTGIKPAS